MAKDDAAASAVAFFNVGSARATVLVAPARCVKARRRRRRKWRWRRWRRRPWRWRWRRRWRRWRHGVGWPAARAAVVLGPVILRTTGPLVPRSHRLGRAPAVLDVGHAVTVVLVVPARRVSAGTPFLLRDVLAADATVRLRIVVLLSHGPLVPTDKSLATAVVVEQVVLAPSAIPIVPALGVGALRRCRRQSQHRDAHGVAVTVHRGGAGRQRSPPAPPARRR